MANYLTRAEADTYFSAVLANSAWTAASNGDKDKALTMATRTINNLSFRGAKTDSEQANAFPRGEDSYTPQEILWACAEIAAGYLNGFDPTQEQRNHSVLSEKIDAIAVTYSEKSKQEWELHGIPSFVAWNYLLPFLAGKFTLGLHKA
jgi:hypothetical protein